MAVAGRAFGRKDKSGLRPATVPESLARSLKEVLANVLGLRSSNQEFDQHNREPGPPLELDCLRGRLTPELLKAAATRSADINTGADQILIRRGVIGEEYFTRCFADHHDIGFETFAGVFRNDCPLSDFQLIEAARHGILPLRKNGRLVYVFEPENFAARRIAKFLLHRPGFGNQIRVTTRARFDEFLERHTGGALAHHAAGQLAENFYDVSAAPIPLWRSPFESFLRYLARLTVPLILFTLMPMVVIEICGVVLSLWFLLFTSLRLAGSFAPREQKPRLTRLPDDALPVYTVIAALYKEATSVGPLMRSIESLDYPREKLDVHIVIEPDDLETRAALSRLGPMPHVLVTIAPNVGPRTKPKALNCALINARGTFVTVFDAEDRPEPGQLRAALDVFRSSDQTVACAQASLCIDNTSDSWLARMFTAEYAGQFDVFLQGFSSFQMPLPLGGSSNHFRTSVLRQVGGWDPYNVTEDADLGFRLARFGYRSVMFASTTYEEAPARFGPWLRQRSRWMKGWMQTWSVHMRSPLQFCRDAGARGFFTLNLLVGGNILTALTQPILMLGIFAEMALAFWEGTAPSFFQAQFAGLYFATIAAGYVSTAIVGLIGLSRRGLLHHAWVLLLTPLYWLCLSIAAWRALYQLLRDPYRWEKTEHGLAQSSRWATRMARRTYSQDEKMRTRGSV